MKEKSRNTNNNTVYNLRKSLLYLQRARIAAAQSGDSETFFHIKQLSFQITQRIKSLTNDQ